MINFIHKIDLTIFDVSLKTREIRRITNKCGRHASKFFITNLNRQSYYDGDILKKYSPLKESTKKYKKKKGYSSKILHATHNMKKSYTKALINNNTYRIGNTTPYAKYHQTGTKHMPARPLFYIPQKLVDELNEIIKQEIENKLISNFKKYLK